MSHWTLPEWMAMPEWLDPKLLVLFVLIGTVLFLSRDRDGARARGERRVAAILKHDPR
jgi:hypothetical protein